MIKLAFILIYIIFISQSIYADDIYTVSGNLNLRGVEASDSDNVKEYPGAAGRVKLDVSDLSWKFHSWLEGGWDGSVKRPARDKKLFKNYSDVYQSNTPYLEFKEFYLQYSSAALDLRAGIQRFAWGRLDEFPPNDMLNPCDYTQFLRKPLEDRKIGVPSMSASMLIDKWTCDMVWIPVLVPYRLSMPDERWSGISNTAFLQIPGTEIVPGEPDLPQRRIGNSNIGMRVKRTGDIEWALNLYRGYDPRPVFKTTSLKIIPQTDIIKIDPGYVPDFRRITSIGLDGAAVMGDWSLRAEAAYIMNRYYNIRRELWGYPTTTSPGVYPLNTIGYKTDVLDYGIGADYRLFEDVTLIIQAQQTVIPDRPENFYERKVETILWANIKVTWMNQKVETNASIAYNPEHGASMAKANIRYIFTDAWKAGITAIILDGPPQSVFGRYSKNDQVEAELMYSW
ncbi:MAG: hypothetical protein V1874_08025 [Spirochaetota bacterium]